MTTAAETAATYRAFVDEVGTESSCFADWAARVAADPDVLDRIGRLPESKRQPNLVFAAARFTGVPAPGPYEALRSALLSDDGALEGTILSRSTQTNEVGRLTALTPLLARLGTGGTPLALIEVGASAGLCLFPDRYRYEWTDVGRFGPPDAPLLRADAAGRMPLPDRTLAVSWRCGIDLHPLDVSDPEDAAWLRTLIWPEQRDRRARLDIAIEVARREPPRLVAGDLFDRLEAEIELAARSGLVVVLHSAVIAYLPPSQRERFDRLMRRLVSADRCRWISNEGEHVLPSIAATARGAGRPGERFVLGLDGTAVARTHGHGASLTWLDR